MAVFRIKFKVHSPEKRKKTEKTFRNRFFRMEKQQTLKEAVKISGIALHTGVRATLQLNPAPENSGICFRRIDLPGKPVIPALATNVVDVQRGTSIGCGEAVVYTVEHIMSALHAHNVDNCIVDMDGGEPPICDGSSAEFVKMIQTSGIVSQNAPAQYYTPSRPLRYQHGPTQVAIFPDPEKLAISCITSFRGCPFDPQFFEYTVNPDDYDEAIAPGRTFVDYRDLRMLIGMGLVKGGSLDAAAIIHDGAIICKDRLRFDNEIVRHKILDMIGDLYLTGKRLRGNVIAIKPGHPANVALAKMIIQDFPSTK